MVPSLKQSTATQGNPVRAAFSEIVSFFVTFFYLVFSLSTENKYLSLISSPVFVVRHFVFINCFLQIVLLLFIHPRLNPTGHEYSTKKKHGAQSTLLTICQSVMSFFGFWAVAHFLAVIFGAPFFENAEETSTWAALVASLIAVPGLCIIGPKPRKWLALFNMLLFDTTQKRTLFYCTVGTIVGSWGSAIVIPLDWDRPWQAWPIPGVVGAMSGYLLGLLASGLKIVKDLKFSKVH